MCYVKRCQLTKLCIWGELCNLVVLQENTKGRSVRTSCNCSDLMFDVLHLTSMPSPSRSFSTWPQRSFIFTLDCQINEAKSYALVSIFSNGKSNIHICSCNVHWWMSLLTIFAKVLISASTQSGQSWSPQKRNRCKTHVPKRHLYSLWDWKARTYTGSSAPLR